MNLAAERLAALRQERTSAIGLGRHPATERLEAVIRRFAARSTSRRDQPIAAELAATLDTISRRCASGESLSTALRGAVAPTLPAFARVQALLGRGCTVQEALSAFTTTDPDVSLAVHVLDLCATQGGNVSESLDRAAATLRERHAVRLEREAQSAQARLSARVLTVVPIAFAAWTLATTPAVRAFTATPPGFACLALGAAVNLTGWRLMRRAIRSAG